MKKNLIIFILGMIALSSLIFAYDRNQEADQQRKLAEFHKLEAQKQRVLAEHNARMAENERKRAMRNEELARLQAVRAHDALMQKNK